MKSYKAYLESLFTALSELGVFQKSGSDVPSFPNRLWYRWGYSDADFEAGRWYDYIHPEDRERVLRSHNALLGGEREIFREEYRIRTSEGEYRNLWSTGRFVNWEQDSPNAGAYVGLDIDISHLKREVEEHRQARTEAEQKARQAEMLQQAGKIVTASLDLHELVRVILVELGKVVPFGEGAIYGQRGGRLMELSPEESLRDDGEQPPRWLEADSLEVRILAEGSPVWTREMIAVPLSLREETIGLLLLKADEAAPFAEADAELVFSLTDFVSIALANANLYRETRRLAMEDSLTGLPTRRWFMSHGQKMLIHAMRYNRPVALMMLDIDNFKSYNDNNGHPAGDVALKRVAGVCLETIRRADLSCRYGGEEMAILLIEAGRETAPEVAERIRAAVEALVIAPDLPRLTVSIGLAALEPEGGKLPQGLDILIEQADKLLYRAKVEGKNRVAG